MRAADHRVAGGAARAAGAAKIVVVDSPERRLEAVLDADDVVLAIQEQPLGTADAVKAAAAEIAGRRTVVVLNGDVPLITGATLSAWSPITSTAVRARGRSRRRAR